MNDLKLLNVIEKKFNSNAKYEFITFDTNMSMVYVSDNKKVYGIETETLEVH